MRKQIFLVPLLAFLVGCHSVGPVSNAVETENVSPAVAAERVLTGEAVLIDVREPDEWAETGVAEPAFLLPLSDLQEDREQWEAFLGEHGNRELLLYCRSGNRAAIAAEILAEEGYSVGNVGGFRDWQAAELPERQARDL